MKDIYFLFASNFPGLSNCLMFGHGTGNCIWSSEKQYRFCFSTFKFNFDFPAGR